MIAVLFVSAIAFEHAAHARAGGGTSSGSRGSRSYSAPTRSYSSPEPQSQPAQPPPYQQPAGGGGFMRGLAGGILGGLIGGMLFRSLGFAGFGNGFGGGIGLFEILLVLGIGYFLYRKIFGKKKAEAMKMFQGVSTGFGPWGSIEWVLAASAVIGAAEAVLSAGASSEGARLLGEAIQAERKLRNEGIFFTVGNIQFIENPIPGFWRVPVKKDIQIKVPVYKIFVVKELPTETRTAKVTSAFVHNGDEFISVMADDNTVSSIRWNAIERYVHQKIGS